MCISLRTSGIHALFETMCDVLKIYDETEQLSFGSVRPSTVLSLFLGYAIIYGGLWSLDGLIEDDD